MSREWQPGDVAIWTDSTGETHRIFREGYGERGDMKARWFGAMCGEAWPEPFDDVRPLVVIDPEDREQVERLAKAAHGVEFAAAWDEMHGGLRAERIDVLQAALREFADPKPPRCTASLTVFDQSVGHECRESAGHDGPHVAAGASWTEAAS